MNVLITGHKGLIGSRLYTYYKEIGFHVYGYDIKDNWKKICDIDFDVIHHCASLCIIRDVIANPEQMCKNNDITFKVLEIVRKCKPAQLYMYSSNRVTSEIDSPYVASKIFLEAASKGYCNCYEYVSCVIIRPETIWGYKKDDVRVMSNWIEKALKNKDIIIYGNSDKELSPLYVDDFINKVTSLDYYKREGKVVTITGEVRKAYKIAQFIITKLNSSSKIVFKDAELTQPQKSVIRKRGEIRAYTNLSNDIERYINYKELFGD